MALLRVAGAVRHLQAARTLLAGVRQPVWLGHCHQPHLARSFVSAAATTTPQNTSYRQRRGGGDGGGGRGRWDRSTEAPRSRVSPADLRAKQQEIIDHVKASGATEEEIAEVKSKLSSFGKRLQKMAVPAPPQRRRFGRQRVRIRDRPTIEAIPDRTWVSPEPKPLSLPRNKLDSRVIETKRTVNMTTGGKRPSRSALVVVGNGNGAIGFAVGKSKDVRTAITKAIQKAARHLVVIDRLDGHTIHHDINTKYCRTQLKMRRVPKGHGLRCHQSVSMICQLAGIQDLGCDIVGSTNPLNVVRATFQALSMQKPIQELARARGKSVLRFDKPDAPPTVVARNRTGDNVDEAVDMSRLSQEARLYEWLGQFPRAQTVENFAQARQLRRKLEMAPDSAEALNGLDSDIVQWLQAMPAHVDLSNSVMAESLG